MWSDIAGRIRRFQVRYLQLIMVLVSRRRPRLTYLRLNITFLAITCYSMGQNIRLLWRKGRASKYKKKFPFEKE